MPLLSVVLDEFADVGLDDADLGEDLLRGGGPDEWFRFGFPVGDVVPDPVE